MQSAMRTRAFGGLPQRIPPPPACKERRSTCLNSLESFPKTTSSDCRHAADKTADPDDQTVHGAAFLASRSSQPVTISSKMLSRVLLMSHPG
jgi:hypothetical protein